MKPTYVIWFLSKDEFHGKLPLYTAKTQIAENPKLKYDDKRVTIYLNPGVYGEDNDVNAICKYLMDGNATDLLTEEIEESIERIKSNDESWRMFMSLDEWLEHEKEEGKQEQAINTAKKMLEKNFSLAEINELTGLSIEEIKKLKQ